MCNANWLHQSLRGQRDQAAALKMLLIPHFCKEGVISFLRNTFVVTHFTLDTLVLLYLNWRKCLEDVYPDNEINNICYPHLLGAFISEKNELVVLVVITKCSSFIPLRTLDINQVCLIRS